VQPQRAGELVRLLTQPEPAQILENIYQRAASSLNNPVIQDAEIRERVEFVCRCLSNRSGVRLLMSCMLGKIHRPEVDPRKPYTEIGGEDCFSGRTYDEQHLTHFINSHRLPCNSTTAFLTPALRNMNQALTTDRDLVGQPRELYSKTLFLLDDVAQGRIPADIVFVETVRILLQMRNEKLKRMESLLETLKHKEGA